MNFKLVIVSVFIYLAASVAAMCASMTDAERLKAVQELQEQRFQLLLMKKGQSPEKVLQGLSRLSEEWTSESEYMMMGDVYHMRVWCYILQGDYGWAFNEVNNIVEEGNNPLRMAFSYYALGDVYYSMNLLDQAVANYLLAREYLEKRSGTERYRMFVNFRLLFIYLLQERLADAQNEYLSLQTILANLNPALWPPSTLMDYARASLYIANGDFENSRKIIDKLTAEGDSVHNPYNLVGDQLSVAYYSQREEWEQAYKYVQKCIETSYRMYDVQWHIHSLEWQSQIKMKLGDLEGACEDSRHVFQLKDSLMNNSFMRQDNTLHLTFRVDDSASLVWKELQRMLYIFIICMVALLIVGLVLTMLYKKKNKRLDASLVRLDAAKKEVNESIQAKSLFLSNMSHEIRTPLNAISGFSELLVSQKDLDMELRKQCNEMIQQNSNLLMKLLNDVLDLSNLDIQKMSFKFRNCNVVPLSRAIVETIKGIKRTEAEVSFQTTLDELFLYTDENRLQQMLLNILVNATKFTKSGSIVLSLEVKDDGLAYFAVTDTGIGISPEKQDKVFSRFEKLDENSYGYGLGLSICKLIINRLGGRIWIDSDYKDGARFVFTHPIKHPHNK